MTNRDRPAPDFTIVTNWCLEAEPEELTAIVLDPDVAHLWGPRVFLHSELIERGRPDGLGLAFRLHIKGFLPHSFFFEARIVDLVPHRSMKVAVSGDFEGAGEMWVTPVGGGLCEVQLRWRILIHHPYVRRFIHALHPVFVWNHKWAARSAHRLLQAEVYRRRAGSSRVPQAPATFPHNVALYRRWQRRRSAARGWRGACGMQANSPSRD